MKRFGRMVGIGAAVAAGALALGVVPAGSQSLPQAPNPVTITGTATCNPTGGTDGAPVWDVSYTIKNNLQPPSPQAVPAAMSYDVTVEGASITLGAESEVIDFDPTVIAPGETAASEGTIPGELTGTLVLDLDYSWEGHDGPIEASYELALSPACVSPATTTTSTVPDPGPAVQAVAVATTPAFTG